MLCFIVIVENWYVFLFFIRVNDSIMEWYDKLSLQIGFVNITFDTLDVN